MAKTIQIACTESIQKILSDSLKLYAELAFPVSGSECDMVAHDALKTSAEEFYRQFSETGCIELSRRLKPMLRAAITTYYKLLTEQSGVSQVNECALVLSFCEGQSISDQQLQQAKAKDLIGQQ